MGLIPFSIIVAVLAISATTSDRIDKLVVDLSSDPMWENGDSPALDLPETASTKQVVAETLKMTGFPVFPRGAITYKILEVRRVHIKGSLPDLYTAVLLKTDHLGYQIMLIKHLGHPGSWWTAIFGANRPGYPGYE
jgi:hypothetical protein